MGLHNQKLTNYFYFLHFVLIFKNPYLFTTQWNWYMTFSPHWIDDFLIILDPMHRKFSVKHIFLIKYLVEIFNLFFSLKYHHESHRSTNINDLVQYWTQSNNNIIITSYNSKMNIEWYQSLYVSCINNLNVSNFEMTKNTFWND